MVEDRAVSEEAVYSYDPDATSYWNQLESCFAIHADGPTSQPTIRDSALRQGLTNEPRRMRTNGEG